MNMTICYKDEEEAKKDDDDSDWGKGVPYRERAETDNTFGLGCTIGVDILNGWTDGLSTDCRILVIHSLAYQLASTENCVSTFLNLHFGIMYKI